MRTNVILAAGLLSSFALSVSTAGCQCINDDNFTPLTDAGFDVPDAGPPPPVFPLKPGDTLTIPQMGGNVDACAAGGQSGDCDRNIKVTYIISDVALNDEQRWEITADVFYEGLVEKIPASALLRLALENTAEFESITAADGVDATGAVFSTDQAPRLDALYRPNNFPFFQAENPLDDGDDGEVFAEAAAEFRAAIIDLDADAAVETQVAAGKLEAYFKDSLGGPVSLHKLLVEVHPMGFVCGWDESLIDFTDTTTRAESSFSGATKRLKAAFFQPNLNRGGVTYQCSCFSRTCSAAGVCLDPTDPDAAPSAEACNVQ